MYSAPAGVDHIEDDVGRRPAPPPLLSLPPPPPITVGAAQRATVPGAGTGLPSRPGFEREGDRPPGQAGEVDRALPPAVSRLGARSPSKTARIAVRAVTRKVTGASSRSTPRPTSRRPSAGTRRARRAPRRVGVEGAPVEPVARLGDHPGRRLGIVGLLRDQAHREDLDGRRAAGVDHQAELAPGGIIPLPPVGPVGAQEIALDGAVATRVATSPRDRNGVYSSNRLAVLLAEVEPGGQVAGRAGGAGAHDEPGPVLAVPARQVDVDAAAEPRRARRVASPISMRRAPPSWETAAAATPGRSDGAGFHSGRGASNRHSTSSGRSFGTADPVMRAASRCSSRWRGWRTDSGGGPEGRQASRARGRTRRERRRMGTSGSLGDIISQTLTHPGLKSGARNGCPSGTEDSVARTSVPEGQPFLAPGFSPGWGAG